MKVALVHISLEPYSTRDMERNRNRGDDCRSPSVEANRKMQIKTMQTIECIVFVAAYP